MGCLGGKPKATNLFRGSILRHPPCLPRDTWVAECRGRRAKRAPDSMPSHEPVPFSLPRLKKPLNCSHGRQWKDQPMNHAEQAHSILKCLAVKK